MGIVICTGYGKNETSCAFCLRHSRGWYSKSIAIELALKKALEDVQADRERPLKVEEET